MKKILKPARSGKTVELIKLSAANKSIIICSNYQRVLQVQKMAKDLKLDVKNVISWNEFLYRKDSMRGINIVLDNVDEILGVLCEPAKIDAITMTTND